MTSPEQVLDQDDTNGKQALPTLSGVILARMDSARLPRKPLAEVGEKKLVDYLIERAWKLDGLDSLCLATTDRSIDDELVAHAKSKGLQVYRGSCENVAERLLACATNQSADFVLRLNGDSPYIDTKMLNAAIRLAKSDKYDFLTNLLPRTYPYGVSVEIVRVRTLAQHLVAFSESDAEHVTQFFYRNLDRFNVAHLKSQQIFPVAERVTIDTAEDLREFVLMIQKLGSEWATANLVDILKAYEEVRGN